MMQANACRVGTQVIGWAPHVTADDVDAVAADVQAAATALDAARGSLTRADLDMLRGYIESAQRTLTAVRAELVTGQQPPRAMLTAARGVRRLVCTELEQRRWQRAADVRAARLAQLRRDMLLAR